MSPSVILHSTDVKSGVDLGHVHKASRIVAKIDWSTRTKLTCGLYHISQFVELGPQVVLVLYHSLSR